MLSAWFSIGKPGSSKCYCKTITPLLVLWEIWKESCRRRFDEGYLQHEAQKEAVVRRVLHWINRLYGGFIPKTSSPVSFKIIACNIKIKAVIFNPKFSLVLWKRDTIQQWVLNINGSSKDNMVSSGSH